MLKLIKKYEVNKAQKSRERTCESIFMNVGCSL
jgi:hypothetical protein